MIDFKKVFLKLDNGEEQDLHARVDVKEEAGVTSRCMPFAQETLADTCVCCGRPAKAMVVWGKAY